MRNHPFKLTTLLLIALVALTVIQTPTQAVSTTLVINEVDYDQPGADSAEFIEIKNISGGSINLSGYELVLVNGGGGGASLYATIPLSNRSLGPNDYHVICRNVGNVPNCNQIVSNLTVENGASDNGNTTPDALAIRKNSTNHDILSYEGSVPGYTESEGSILREDTIGVSLSRCADGLDTDNNSTDFVVASITPGAANSCGTVPTATPSTNEPTATTAPQNTSTPENTATYTATADDPTATSIANTATATPTQQNTATHTATADASTSTATATTDAATSTPQATNTAAPSCENAPDSIYELQEGGGKHNNSSTASPSRAVVGVVTGEFPGLDGYYLQAETGDGNPATSDGVFVYDPQPYVLDVVVGQRLRVTGTTREQFGQTQFDVTAILNCGAIGNITPTTINLPISNLNQWEQYEGMLIKVNGPLTVTETFTLARFGEVVVSAGGRLFQPTNYVEPGTQAQSEQQLNDRRRLLIDDGRNGTPADGQVPYIPTTESVFRQGFTTPNVTGVLGFGFSSYRLQPTTPIEWTPSNPREPAPLTASRLRVASFNLLNYFNTFTNCFGTQADNCRGADTQAEFDRQRPKTTAAIIGMDADVIAVNELENDATDGSSAVERLIADLNSAAGSGTYAFINTGQIGSDAIRVGILYNATTVTPVGTFAKLDNVDPFNRNTRPPLAQVFEEISTGERFIVIANHFKSKGSCPENGDANFTGNNDTGDGQGCWNADRVKAATEILNWINTDPYFDSDADVLIIGDLNSYAQEDPIDTIKAGGFTNLIQQYVGAGNFAYSYTFQGQSGYLDHALANASFAAQIVDAAEWHINADEPIGRDYNDAVNTAENPADLRQPYLYQPNAYRSSDHDPVIVGVFAPGQPNTSTPDSTVASTVTPDGTSTNTPTATLDTTTTPDATVTTALTVTPDGTGTPSGTATVEITTTPDATVTAEATTAATSAPTNTTAVTPTATNSANSELIVNGGFETNGESNLVPWQLKKGSGDKVKCNNEDKTFAYEGDCAFQFKGGAGENAKLQQDIVLTTATFSSGDVLDLSAYIRAPKSSVKGKVKLVVKYSDGTDKGKATIDFVPAASYTLFDDSYTVLSSSIEKIKVQIDHKSPSGKVLIDAVSVQQTVGGEDTELMPLP